MKAILLSAGLGTRLRPLTDKIPKCLMPIKNRPLLDYWIYDLIECGISEILINTHYLSNQVSDFINNHEYRDLITISHEKLLLGTAGTLLNNINFYNNNDGFLIHADNYCTQNLSSLIKAHNRRPEEAIMTMMGFRSDNPSSCGILELDNQKLLKKFHEKVANPPSNLANSAIYIISSDLIKILKTKKEFQNISDFSNQLIPKLLNKIYVYETNKKIIDIGTLEAYRPLI